MLSTDWGTNQQSVYIHTCLKVIGLYFRLESEGVIVSILFSTLVRDRLDWSFAFGAIEGLS